MTGAIVEKQQSPPLRIERKDIEPMEGNKEKEQNNTKQETDDVDKNTQNFFETKDPYIFSHDHIYVSFHR